MALLIHILIPHVILKVVHTLINTYWSDQYDQIIILNWVKLSGLSRNGSCRCKVIQKSRFFNSHDPPRSWQIQISDIFWILAFPVSFWPIISFLDNSAILLNSIPRHGFNEIRGAMFSYLAVPIYLCGKLSKKGCWGSCSLKEIVYW